MPLRTSGYTGLTLSEGSLRSQSVLRQKRRGRCPHRPAPAKPELPGNPREVRTTFSAENGCCALRTPADIGCLLRNNIQNLPFRQRYAGKTVHLCCRSPHGERGLKSGRQSRNPPKRGSLPPRGAWIEMDRCWNDFCLFLSLPPRGAWIEI